MLLSGRVDAEFPRGSSAKSGVIVSDSSPKKTSTKNMSSRIWSRQRLTPPDRLPCSSTTPDNVRWCQDMARTSI